MSRFPPKREKGERKKILSYVPHGHDHTMWRKYETPEELEKVKEFRKKFLGELSDKVKFIVLYDSRNIRRKQTSDLIMAYDIFLKSLPVEKRDECMLWLHTEIRDDNGTDLQAVLDEITPDIKAIFTGSRIAPDQMVLLYNNADVIASVSSAEGFGLSILQSILTETMFIANVIGGMQDMMGFVDENGEYLTVNKHFSYDWGSNADGRYKTHGEWCIPVFPNNRSLIGSIPTPYIFESRCDQKEVAKAIEKVYNMSSEERDRRGKLGREFALLPEVGMTAAEMGNRIINSIDELLDSYETPRKFGIYTV